MTQENARVATNVVACTLLLENHYVYVLIDPSSTHSFVARKIKDKLNVQPIRLKKIFLISTPFGDIVFVNHMHKSIRILLKYMIW
jgi:hypothetical protein